MVCSWKKNANASNHARQRLSAAARRLRHRDGRVRIEIPPVANRAIVRVAQTRVGSDKATCGMVCCMMAGMMVATRDFIVRARCDVVVDATGNRVQPGTPGNRNQPMQGQQQNGNGL